MKRPDLYPGFEQLYQELGTTLTADDVRRVLRYEVRRRVQDDRGAAFPLGDFVEDVQLQKAIEIALGKLGKKPTDVSDFNLVFDLPRISLGFTSFFGKKRRSHQALLATVLVEPEEQRLSLVWQSTLRVPAPETDYLDATEVTELRGGA